MSSRVHWVQHAPADDLGCIAPWLAARGLGPRRTAFYEGDAAPPLGSFDRLLILGGSMNVDEEALYPWLTAEKRFIAEALAAGKRILGICLGAQLLAEALGARVARNPVNEIGWFDLTLSEAGRRSPWFADFPGVYPAMHWHGYGYELPRGATLLASSGLSEQQAFEYDGGRVLALQYHPEVTAANLRRWLSDEHLDAASGLPHPAGMAEDLAAFATANRLTYAMLDRWFGSNA
ncbi:MULTISPECIES: type 1 glutamine amidotransferase [Hydrocarboniphaga]|uniref:type 1 glutamine amidotransferase n=1 Tax=Hydrocarboniphaga TaxID=243627 RepID=UPI00058F7BAA|nr:MULTISPECIES: type 1 glutamine amidotransferase [Hydrocarboniphaga]MDZ4078974.1 type 1 glutamine amidotransferase [Hydrocarboniphaga sp.]